MFIILYAKIFIIINYPKGTTNGGVEVGRAKTLKKLLHLALFLKKKKAKEISYFF